MNSKLLMTEWVKSELKINLDLRRRLNRNIINYDLPHQEYLNQLVSLGDRLELDMAEDVIPLVSPSYQINCCNLVEIAYEFIDWHYLVRYLANLVGEYSPDEERGLQGFSNLITQSFTQQFWNSSKMIDSWQTTWNMSNIGQEIGKDIACRSWYESLFYCAERSGHPVRIHAGILIASLQTVNWQEVVDSIDDHN
jgi:hypothetical protein